MTKHRILLIGPQGQVGWELLRCVQPFGQVFAADRSDAEQGTAYIDLADFDSIRSVVREVRPAIILNAAAYTAVDKAETDVEITQKINGSALSVLAEEALSLNALLVHYSTDYVFDGTHTQPYVEQDVVNPLSVYGASKLAGEQAIQAVGGQYLILRTSWVYAARGKNFLLTMQRLAKEREELRVVNDQTGSPTWSRMIAQATVHILAQLYSPLQPIDINRYSGVYHLTCAGQTTWYEFAKAIIEQEDRQPRVLPITTTEYPTPAKRPAYSVLSNEKLAQTFGIRLPNWDTALELCLNEMRRGEA